MARANEQFVVIFEQKGPLGGVQRRCSLLRLDSIVAVELGSCDLLSAQRHIVQFQSNIFRPIQLQI